MDAGDVVAGRYELVFKIGHGGMGEVWQGFDQHLDRHIAIKFLRDAVFADPEASALARKRLRREARATARIDHPGVPTIHDFGPYGDDQVFLVMEHVKGLTVMDLLHEQDGRLPLPWAAAIGAQLCAVLTVAHAESLIHRDLKPENLMLRPDGTLKVLDFGIVALLDPAMEETKITEAGFYPGTPAYMAPEYITTGAISPHTDLYAVGCILHELLCGEKVFQAPTPMGTAAMHMNNEPPTLDEFGVAVPEEIQSLISALLKKVPEERPQAAAEVYERLIPFVADLPPLPGATVPAPSPDPARMYAAVAGRIAETALVGPPVTMSLTPPRPPRTVRFSREDVAAARAQAEELAGDGLYTQAVELLRSTVGAASEALGADDNLVLALRKDMADVMLFNRDFQHASEEFADLAARLADLAGPLHDLVLDCRHKEAGALAGLGRNHEAVERLRALLPDYESTYGHTSDEAFGLREEIGRLLMVNRRYDTVWPMLRGLLVDLGQFKGEHHPATERVRRLIDRLDQTREDSGN
ncbi:serine/threonine-protein kinase [Spirillospora sp. NPDC047418]